MDLNNLIQVVTTQIFASLRLILISSSFEPPRGKTNNVVSDTNQAVQ